MSDPLTNVEIDDVLSSIRRLLSEDGRGVERRPAATPAPARPKPAPCLVLTPAFRVVEPTAPVAGARKPDAGPSVTPAKAAPTDPSLEQRIAELEAAVGARLEDWEPDGSEAESRSSGLSFSEMGEHDQSVWAERAADEEAAAMPVEPPKAEAPRAPRPTAREDAPHLRAVEDVPPPAQPAEVAESPMPRRAGPRPVDTARFRSEDDIDQPEGSLQKHIWDAVMATIDTVEADARASEEAAEESAATRRQEPAAAPQDRRPRLSLAQAHEEEAEAKAIAARESKDALPPATIDEAVLRDMVGELIREELRGELGERITRNVRRLVRREIYRALAARDLQ